MANAYGTLFKLSQASFSLIHACVVAYVFHRTDLITDLEEHHSNDDMGAAARALVAVGDDAAARTTGGGGSAYYTLIGNLSSSFLDSVERRLGVSGSENISGRALLLQMMVAFGCIVACPASLFCRRKELLLHLALILAGCALLLHASLHTQGAHLGASFLLGAAYGLANGYSSTLWEYFFGSSDASRIRQTSLAITSATSGCVRGALSLREGTFRVRLRFPDGSWVFSP